MRFGHNDAINYSCLKLMTMAMLAMMICRIIISENLNSKDQIQNQVQIQKQKYKYLDRATPKACTAHIGYL